MTVEFVILPDLFQVNREKQEEDMQEFDSYVLPELYPQLKGLIFVSVHFLNCGYFIENYQPRNIFCPSI